LILYFETSFLLPLFLPEPTSERVENFLRRQRTEALAISHWTRVEFFSTLARQVRMGGLGPKAARDVDAEFTAVAAKSFINLLPIADDFDLSMQYLRRYKSGLRAGDALHLAIAANNKAEAIYSLDNTFLKAGRKLGLPVRRGIQLP
jgi:predicted nucleic acid-binding protein